MGFLSRLLTRPAPVAHHPVGRAEAHLEATHLALVGALAYGVQERERRIPFVAHSARVGLIADHLAQALDVSAEGRDDLVRAAQLHEVGMIGVPPHLLETRTPLSPEELSLVRSQARIGAEIVRPTHPARIAWLIEHQYSDHHELSRAASDEEDLLLAGLLRVADAADAVTNPRPYQDPLSAQERENVLINGAGTRFHPRAVAMLLAMPDAVL